MSIRVKKGDFEGSLIVGDIVKLERCLLEDVEDLTQEKIEDILGIIVYIPEKEDYIDIRLGDNASVYDTIRFHRRETKPKICSSYSETKYNGYLYNIHRDNQLHFTVLKYK